MLCRLQLLHSTMVAVGTLLHQSVKVTNVNHDF
jgi:hypothetical protein